MDDKAFEAYLIDAIAAASAADRENRWKIVTYKRSRRPHLQNPNSDDELEHPDDVASTKAEAKQMLRAIETAVAAAAAAEATAMAAAARARPPCSESEDREEKTKSDDEEGETKVLAKISSSKKKNKKKILKKKLKIVTFAEAADAIDAHHLQTFLTDLDESEDDVELMRVVEYFAGAFENVDESPFQWVGSFGKSNVDKFAEFPLCHISEPVYKTSTDWIAHKSSQSLVKFASWCMERILSDLETQLAASNNLIVSAHLNRQVSVATYVILALILKRKPDILMNLLPDIRDNSKYEGQEKLPVMVWIISQANQGDLLVGMYLWAHYLFPMVCGKSNGNPQPRDLVLQLVESILSQPKAQTILLNGAVRKGEHLVPPSAFDLLLRYTFPSPIARVKATQRFEAIYPTLKELAIASSPGRKTTKRASKQILSISVQSMKHSRIDNPELFKEGVNLFIWCLANNNECYVQWVKIHLDNVDASIGVLQELYKNWEDYSMKFSSHDALKLTLNNLRNKNKKALSENADFCAKRVLIKEADEYCKKILGKFTYKMSYIKDVVFILIFVIALLMAFFQKSLDWEKLRELLNSIQSRIM